MLSEEDTENPLVFTGLSVCALNDVLARVTLVDVMKLGAASKACFSIAMDHLAFRTHLSIYDIPEHVLDSSQLHVILRHLRHPRSLTVALSLSAPPPSTAAHARLAAHFRTFDQLRSVTLYLDETEGPAPDYQIQQNLQIHNDIEPAFTALDSPRGGYGASAGLPMASSALQLATRAIAESGASVEALAVGGLTRPHAADMTEALAAVSRHLATTLHSLTLRRLSALTAECLRTLARVPDRVNENSDDGATRSGPQARRESVAARLEHFSLFECDQITDDDLTAVLEHAPRLRSVSMAPGDGALLASFRRSGAQGGPAADLAAEAHIPPPGSGPVGFLSACALAATASRLTALRLSDEASPSTFHADALVPVLRMCTELNHLHLNIPVNDRVAKRIEGLGGRLRHLTLNCTSLSPPALTGLLQACTRLEGVALFSSLLCALPRGFSEASLLPLERSAPTLRTLCIDGLAGVSADWLMQLIFAASETTRDATAHALPRHDQLARRRQEPQAERQSAPGGFAGHGEQSRNTATAVAPDKTASPQKQPRRRSSALSDASICSKPSTSHTVSTSASRLRVVEASECKNIVLWGGGCLPRGAFPAVTKLSLDNLTSLGRASEALLCAALPHFPALRELSLQGYDGATDAVLGRAVAACPVLRVVDLERNDRLTDAGLDALLVLPAGQLSELKVAACGGVAGAAVLRVIAAHADGLRRLDVWGTCAGGNDFARLVQGRAAGHVLHVNLGGSLATASNAVELVALILDSSPETRLRVTTRPPVHIQSRHALLVPRDLD